jgi:SAM-dependent methyltransferase
MVEQLPSWAPAGVDPNTASIARVYDYFLGGEHHFEADRVVAARVMATAPDLPVIVRANRAFLHRAVRYLLGQGVDQFLDLGSGIPSVGNIHETAQQQVPGARVLYVDHDPVAVAQTEHLLRGNPSAQVLQADLRRPTEVLAAADLLDLSRPVAVLLGSVLHFVPDPEPKEIVRQLHERLTPGSYLAVSHVTAEIRPEDSEEIAKAYAASANPVTPRPRAEVVALFEGWDLVEPGAVWVPQWRPDRPEDVGPNPESTSLTVAVARRP